MHDWLKQNQKKLMAVFGALLMVTFLINRSPDDYRNRNDNGAPLGKAGKFILYTNSVRRMRDEWRILQNCYDINSAASRFGPKEAMERLEQIVGFGIDPRRYGYVRAPELLGPSLEVAISENETLFPLLVHEAETRGIGFSEDIVGSVAQNQFHYVSRGEQLTADSPVLRTAIRHFLMVKALRDMVGGDVKLSDPAWRHILADMQRVSLNVVEFSADSMKNFAPPPTTQQVQAQFEQYKNVLPDDPAKPADDVLGFGYKIPDRVKVQYITISRAQAAAAVKASHADVSGKSAYDYDLELKAAKYYYEHQSDYIAAPTTQPAATAPAARPALASGATQPATAPSLAVVSTTQPTTAPAAVASTQPTTRPFAEVQGQIVDKLLEPEVDDLQKKVADAVHDEMALAAKAMAVVSPSTQSTSQPATQAANAAGLPTTLPSTAAIPTSSPSIAGAADAVDASTALGAVALDIQQKFHVLPEVTQLPQWFDESALAHAGPISDAKTDLGTAFAPYIFQSAAAFSTSAPRSSSLQLWQPTVALRDDKNSVYIARLIDVSPAHAPSLADVQARVEEDVRLKWAYDKAKEKANQMLETASHSTLSRAALDDHRAMTSTGMFPITPSRDEPATIPNFLASPDTTAAVRDEAKTLLTKATAESPHPRAILMLPGERRVAIVELGDVVQPIPESRVAQYRSYYAQQEEMGQLNSLTKSWFTLDAVSTRLGYKPDKTGA